MSEALREIIRRNRAGEPVAMPSICTAHPDALLASLMLAGELHWPVLVEATSNQVNQYGGYTGLQPGAFRTMVLDLCVRAQVSADLVTFGGDHLGPQVWRAQPAQAAMAEAEVLVRSYVRAGFRKIHLDCSEGCAGEQAQVGDAVAAERAACLASVCEAEAADQDNLVYVIGTEVPPPGGGRGADQALVSTTTEAARATIEAHRAAFLRHGLGAAFARVVGLVVQPGVDFEPEHVHHLSMEQAMPLRQVLAVQDGLCLEAHSTDYQKAAAYRQLASAGFAIQKVGPALTHAYREAVYALAEMEADDTGQRGEPDIMRVMEQLMQNDPRWWSGHYHGPPERQYLLRHTSLSDRIRYYWPQRAAQEALEQLHRRVEQSDVGETMLSRRFPASVVARSAVLAARHAIPRSRALVLASVQGALRPYFFAAMEAS